MKFLGDAALVVVPVRGQSMRRTLLPGDVAVARGDQSCIRVGDVIVFRARDANGAEFANDGPLVVHRVWGSAGEDGFRTRGDSQWHGDRERVRRADVLGVVVAIMRDGRELRVWGGFRGRWIHRCGRLKLLLRRGLRALLRRLLSRRHARASDAWFTREGWSPARRKWR